MGSIEIAEWTLEAVAGPVPEVLRGVSLPVRAPITALTALLAAALVPDPLLAEHEAEVQWIGSVTWRLTARFELSDDARARLGDAPRLVLEGVDTIATIVLDGVELGRTETMHRPYVFDLAAAGVALRPGTHLLVVELLPVVGWAERERARLGPLPFIEWPGAGHPYNFARKMACTFGWDWGPTVLSPGLWRPVRLEPRPLVEHVRPLIFAHDPGDGRDALRLELHLDPPPHAPPRTQPWHVRATLAAPDGRVVARLEREHAPDEGALELVVLEPQRWWPVGHGAPALHTLALELREHAGGEPVFAWCERLGLRTVELDTSEDEAGSRFLLRVNGKPVFCKGANWIPDDPFLERIDRPRLRRRLEQALGAHHNMLRVWGGGTFESEDFYALCDELGLLVWQDFLFACAMYPEEPPFDALVESEARHHVARLARHASLVLWCGCNENLWAHEDWGWPPWKTQVAGRTWGRGFYLERLPALVAGLDPSRPYWPGSPWSREGIHPLDDAHGTRHVWDAWNETDYTIDRAYRPRFVAEFGHQAPATVATLREGGIPPSFDAPAFLRHQKAIDGHAKLLARLAEHFDVPADAPFERLIYLTQLNQARAVTLGVEWWRSLWPHCTGTLYWQLNDCWPAISWSAIDYGERPKPLWYALRRSFAPRLLTLQPAPGAPLELPAAPRHALRHGPWPAEAAGRLDAVFVNDTDAPWAIEPRARRLDLDGHGLAAHDLLAHTVAPRSVLRLPLADTLAAPSAPRRELVELSAGGERALWFFARDRELELGAARLSASVEPLEGGGGGYVLELTARTLVRDLAVMADVLAPDARADEQLVTLLPGEDARIVVHTAAELAPEALLGVLHCTTALDVQG